MLGTSYPVMMHHIPEDRRPYQIKLLKFWLKFSQFTLT